MADRNHVMPIITPVYPQQNSTFNVSHSTLAIIQDEFKTSLDIMGEILTGESSWTKIFQPSKFFTKYKYFLAITVFANSDEELLEWRGLVESKLRFLPTSLEEIECVQRSHLNPDQFLLPYEKSQGRPSSVWFVGLEISKSNGTIVQLDFSLHIRDFCLLVKSRAHAIFKAGMDIQVNHLKRKDLKDYVPDELKKEKTIPNTVGSRIIARLSTEGRHSISESDELQRSPTSRKRSAEDEIGSNNQKISLLTNDENNSISESEEPQKSPTSERCAQIQTNGNNNKKELLLSNENNFILESDETQKCSLFENEINNLPNILLPTKEENHSILTENEKIEKQSLLPTEVNSGITKLEDSQDNKVSNIFCAEDDTEESDKRKLRLLSPTIA
jgi:poly(A) polymerase